MKHSPLLLVLVLMFLGCKGESPLPVEQIVYDTTKAMLAIKFEVDQKEYKTLKKQVDLIKANENDQLFYFEYTDEELKTIARLELYELLIRHPTLGSGFIISAEGQFLTCAHVINAIEEVPGKWFGTLYNNNKYEIENIKINNDNDLAIGNLVSINPKFSYLTIELDRQKYRSERIMVFGSLPSYDVWFSFLEGRIVWPHIVLPVENGKLVDMIMFNASVRPGWSGGPVLNMYGKVIGVTTIYNKDLVHSYAIPSINKIFAFDRTEEVLDAGRGDAS